MRTPLGAYMGGKSRLAARLLGLFPEHRIYIEAFCGSAALLFRKDRAEYEVLNDLNGDVVNFFETLRDNYEGFLKRAAWQLLSRGLFERYKNEPLEGLPPLERAYRFWYLLKLSYGGRMCVRHVANEDRRLGRQTKAPAPGQEGFYKPSFGTLRRAAPRRYLSFDEEEARAWHKRLGKVVLECKPWQWILNYYDGQDVLFYLDPPYYGVEGVYGDGLFTRGMFQEMASILKTIRGRFLLSLNDRPETREIFAAFNILPLRVNYSIRKTDRSFGELAISNYDWPYSRELK